jgi:FkbM family methyltransferase
MFISTIFDRVRFFNRQRNYKRWLKKPVLNHREGFLFSGKKMFFSVNGYEALQTSLVKKLLENISLFVNVGAHHGYYSCLALSKNIPTIAFEPHPFNCAMISKHINANLFSTSFTFYKAAVGSSSKHLLLYGGGTGGSLKGNISLAPEAEKQTVPVLSLNETIELNDSKSLILVDVEGYETEVLKGATKLFRNKTKPYWIIELTKPGIDEVKEPDFLAIFSYMDVVGYEAWHINDEIGNLIPISADFAKLFETGQGDKMIINALFIPKGDNIGVLLAQIQ